MSWIEALVLGIIQGLTEFLPVSSSGHIEIGKALLDVEIEENVLFTVVLHAATALSTIFVFRKDIVSIIKGLFKFKNNDDFKFSLKIVLSMIPAAIVGVIFEDQIDEFFSGRISLVGGMLIVTAILLLLADRAKNTTKRVDFLHSIIIGVSQAIAILPGMSRSGATISTSVLLGVDKGRAARFSFLMVVPLILGKMGKDIMDGAFSSGIENITPYIIGFAGAFVAGVLACTWMIKLVKNSKLIYFSIYCLIVGVLALVLA